MKRRIVFILGCGRSGTHMVAHMLDSHPDFTVTYEDPKIFSLANSMAMSNHRRDLPELFGVYREWWAKHPFYADKSHPAIWFAEELERYFGENAYFIGIERNVMSTVYSMMHHAAIRKMIERWQDYPVPNPYLGIDEDNVGSYMLRTIEEKCAFKWRAHRDRMERLRGCLNRFMVAQYEEVVRDPQRFAFELGAFLSVPPIFKVDLPHQKSVEKWKKLTAEQTDAIGKIVQSR